MQYAKGLCNMQTITLLANSQLRGVYTRIYVRT